MHASVEGVGLGVPFLNVDTRPRLLERSHEDPIEQTRPLVPLSPPEQILSMKTNDNNRYQHLRDFRVPIPVLDEIFGNEKDLTTLNTAWKELKTNGLSSNEIAGKISQLIFKGLGIEPEDDHGN